MTPRSDVAAAPSGRPPGGLARAVLRQSNTAALATRHRGSDGWPFPALVLVAFDFDGTPLLLTSRLAEHTQNFLQDPRAGLLFDGTAGSDPILAGPRVTVLGRIVPAEAAHHQTRLLDRHPEAATYASLGDFTCWRLQVERAHLVAGFGRVRWLEAAALLVDPALAADYPARAPDLLANINATYGDLLQAHAQAVAGPGDSGAGSWRLTGVDPDGFDLRRGVACRRCSFDRVLPASEIEPAIAAGPRPVDTPAGDEPPPAG